MRSSIITATLLLSAICHAQSAPTIANFGLRAADTAETCAGFATHPAPYTELAWPGVGRSCTKLTAVNMGVATLAWVGDKWLTRHGHPRLGHALQWVSASGSAHGIFNTTRNWRKK